MDVSSEYIQMCDTKEIQNDWSVPDKEHWWFYPKVMKGDIYYWETRNGRKEMIGLCNSNGKIPALNCANVNNKFKVTWLPRQDQLQDMIDDASEFREILIRWRCWMDSLYGEKSMYLNSMEQLWLAFVMKEKYNKVWNNEEWINE